MKRAKTENRGIWLRVLAGFLVFVIAFGIVVGSRTNIAVFPERELNKATRLAAVQLLAESGYANASRFGRMARYTRSVLAGKYAPEDFELASQIAFAQGDYKTALDLTAQAVELFRGQRDKEAALSLQIGYLNVMESDFEEALRWLDRGITLSEDPDARLVRAQVLVNLGRADQAIKDVEVYLRTAENAEAGVADLTNVYEAAGDYATAARLYTSLIDRTGSTEYCLNRAYCYASLGEIDAAASDRDAYAAGGGSEVATADVMLGIGWMRQGEYARAGERFIQALDEGYSDAPSLYYYVVLCAYITGDSERACRYGDQLIDRINGGFEFGNASVNLENATGRLNVTLARTDLSSLCLMTGASHIRMGDFDQAVDKLTKCLEQNEDVVYANYLRGSCLLAAEKYEEAVRDFTVAIDAGEEVEKSRYGRGVCRMQLGDAEGAMEDFDWVLLNGEDPEIFEEAAKMMDMLMNPETEKEH